MSIRPFALRLSITCCFGTISPISSRPVLPRSGLLAILVVGLPADRLRRLRLPRRRLRVNRLRLRVNRLVIRAVADCSSVLATGAFPISRSSV